MSTGWEPALRELVDTRYGSLLARATLASGTRTDAADLVHEALLSTFSARATFDSVAQAEQYVCRAIISRAVDRSRRHGREHVAIGRMAGMTPDAATDPDPDVLGADVVAALAELSPRQRACVLLRHLDDLSVDGTAQVLGISPGAVKRYVSDGIALLNARLGTVASEVVPVTHTSREEYRRDR